MCFLGQGIEALFGMHVRKEASFHHGTVEQEVRDELAWRSV